MKDEELKQGMEYQEESWGSEENAGAERESLSNAEQDDAFDSSAGKKPVPKSLLIFAAVAILLIVVVCVAVSVNKFRGSTKPKEEDKVQEELPEWLKDTPTPIPFVYTAEEVAQLRLNGYTGPEIESYQNARVSAESLINKAMEERTALYEREIKPYMDSASEEFKELYANTWLGQEEITVSNEVNRYSKYTKVVNVDYVKLPSRGNQLFAKLELKSGMILFMNLTPEQYVRLDDAGNIVVEISYSVLPGGVTIVTGLKEVQITGGN